jgi:hypothetical protein
MAKPPKSDEIVDEPGAEDRFIRGVRKALTTPPKPHKDEPKQGKSSSRLKQGKTK